MKHTATFPFALVLVCALIFAACGGSGKTTLLPLPGADGGTPLDPSVMERGDLVAFTSLKILVNFKPLSSAFSAG